MATPASVTDPYYVARDEVQSMVKEARSAHEEWKRLLQSENTARCRRFQDLNERLPGDLRQIEHILQDITVTIETVEGNRERFGLADGEITSRKRFVQTSEKAVREIQEGLNDRQLLAKMERDTCEQETSRGASSGPRQGTNARSGVDKDAWIEGHDDFLADQRQQQRRILGDQNEELKELLKSTQRLGHIAESMNTELGVQQQLLGDLDQDIERETEHMHFVQRRIGRLLQTSDSNKIWFIIALVVLMLLQLFILLYL